MIMRVIIVVAMASVLLSCISWSCPTSLNFIPCADMLSANHASIAYEADGRDYPFDDGFTQYIFCQAGLSDRLEAGVDWNDIEHSGYMFFNAKYLCQSENQNSPAVAIGVRNISEISSISWYTVGYKTVSRGLRFHLGGEITDDIGSILMGCDYALCPNIIIAADFQSGGDKYSALGAFWQATPDLVISLYYARGNSESDRSADYFGLCLNYNFKIDK